MKQHVVTRAYLAEFADPNTPDGHEPFLWVYDREGDAPYRRAPHKVATKSDYYTAKVDGKREDAVEEILSLVEARALPVIRSLAQGRDPVSLSDDERGALALFLGFLETRVPKFRGWVEKMVGDLMKTVSRVTAAHPEAFARTMHEAMEKEGKEPPADVEAVRQFALSGEYEVVANPILSLQMMVMHAPKIAEIIYDLEWRVLVAAPGQLFITSDAPLVRVATERPPARWVGVGWSSPWMEATFPLGPTACLLISQHRPSGREQIAPERVREINLRTAAYAEKEVYGSQETVASGLNRPPDWEWWKPATEEILPAFAESAEESGESRPADERSH